MGDGKRGGSRGGSRGNSRGRGGSFSRGGKDDKAHSEKPKRFNDDAKDYGYGEKKKRDQKYEKKIGSVDFSNDSKPSGSRGRGGFRGDRAESSSRGRGGFRGDRGGSRGDRGGRGSERGGRGGDRGSDRGNRGGRGREFDRNKPHDLSKSKNGNFEVVR